MCEKDGWGGGERERGLIMRESSEYIKEKGWLRRTTHLSVSTSVPLTVNPGSIALRRPTGPPPFFLPGLFPLSPSLPSLPLSLRLPLFLPVLRCLKLIDST